MASLKNKIVNDMPLLEGDSIIPLFVPNVPDLASKKVAEVLSGRWIGQGPLVDKFETSFNEIFGAVDDSYGLAVSSGTAALHLAYIDAGVGVGDEVICPLFTCTATNLPILYCGATPVFCDIDPMTMNVDLDLLESLITPRTKAVSVVNYGGIVVDLVRLRGICQQHALKLILDAAQSLGAVWDGVPIAQYADYTVYSFQAIKHLTTGDGGLLITRSVESYNTLKRIRWFGIDRAGKQSGKWENDIRELGYKYQMTDIAAAIGLAGLEEIHAYLEKLKNLFKDYCHFLDGLEGIQVIGSSDEEIENSSPWLVTVYTDRRSELIGFLRDHQVEAGIVHYRNDRYSVFKGAGRQSFPAMDAIDSKYMVLPLHAKMDRGSVKKICELISQFVS